MKRIEALEELAAKVEAGEKYETMGHTRLCQKAFPNGPDFDGSREAYAKTPAQLAILVWRNDDMNAALAFHNAVLPDWEAVVHTTGDAWVYIPTRNAPPVKEEKAHSNNPARAWLLSILRALIAQEKTQ